jgi:hypothetical protein
MNSEEIILIGFLAVLVIAVGFVMYKISKDID